MIPALLASTHNQSLKWKASPLADDDDLNDLQSKKLQHLLIMVVDITSLLAVHASEKLR